MTEAQWLASDDPSKMLAFLQGRASERKLRLFACTCGRRVWRLLTDGRSRRAVELAERYADMEASDDELHFATVGAENVAETLTTSVTTAAEEAHASAAFVALWVAAKSETAAAYTSSSAGSAAFHAATAAGIPAANGRRAEQSRHADLLRDIFGNPFHAVTLSPPWLTWNSSTVVRLAQAAYDNRILPAGTLDDARLAVLADALEEAGCTEESILGHLRDGGEHYRGCFVVDALLGKD